MTRLRTFSLFVVHTFYIDIACHWTPLDKSTHFTDLVRAPDPDKFVRDVATFGFVARSYIIYRPESRFPESTRVG